MGERSGRHQAHGDARKDTQDATGRVSDNLTTSLHF
jgi:hypothetical protein